MKIVQSYWSKPVKMQEDNEINSRSAGGWIERKYNYISWAFSCLQFKKFYSEIELVTDSNGYNLLVEKLQLPYTSTLVILDELNSYHPDLWALGKIYAYSAQNQPFIHVDGDVFIWDRFPERVEKAPILAQNMESDYSYYMDTYNEVKEHFRFIPEVIEKRVELGQPLHGINAGILGGHDMDFFKEYTRQAIKLVDENKDCMEEVFKGKFNTFYEQCLFYSLYQERSIEPQYLFEEVNEDFDGIANLTAAPADPRYAHAVAGYKKRKDIGEILEQMLLTEYPEYYFRIIQLVEQHQI